ncbi:hypothetical protein HDU76_010226 [Blyttiomyces sp. JEL0837]|nr:hypothetical protein HDU76_010226 [Blyttiomyces sp. JEL0837]
MADESNHTPRKRQISLAEYLQRHNLSPGAPQGDKTPLRMGSQSARSPISSQSDGQPQSSKQDGDLSQHSTATTVSSSSATFTRLELKTGNSSVSTLEQSSASTRLDNLKTSESLGSSTVPSLHKYVIHNEDIRPMSSIGSVRVEVGSNPNASFICSIDPESSDDEVDEKSDSLETDTIGKYVPVLKKVRNRQHEINKTENISRIVQEGLSGGGSLTETGVVKTQTDVLGAVLDSSRNVQSPEPLDSKVLEINELGDIELGKESGKVIQKSLGGRLSLTSRRKTFVKNFFDVIEHHFVSRSLGTTQNVDPFPVLVRQCAECRQTMTGSVAICSKCAPLLDISASVFFLCTGPRTNLVQFSGHGISAIITQFETDSNRLPFKAWRKSLVKDFFNDIEKRFRSSQAISKNDDLDLFDSMQLSARRCCECHQYTDTSTHICSRCAKYFYIMASIYFSLAGGGPSTLGHLRSVKPTPKHVDKVAPQHDWKIFPCGLISGGLKALEIFALPGGDDKIINLTSNSLEITDSIFVLFLCAKLPALIGKMQRLAGRTKIQNPSNPRISNIAVMSTTRRKSASTAKAIDDVILGGFMSHAVDVGSFAVVLMGVLFLIQTQIPNTEKAPMESEGEDSTPASVKPNFWKWPIVSVTESPEAVEEEQSYSWFQSASVGGPAPTASASSAGNKAASAAWSFVSSMFMEDTNQEENTQSATASKPTVSYAPTEVPVSISEASKPKQVADDEEIVSPSVTFFGDLWKTVQSFSADQRDVAAEEPVTKDGKQTFIGDIMNTIRFYTADDQPVEADSEEGTEAPQVSMESVTVPLKAFFETFWTTVEPIMATQDDSATTSSAPITASDSEENVAADFFKTMYKAATLGSKSAAKIVEKVFAMDEGLVKRDGEDSSSETLQSIFGSSSYADADQEPIDEPVAPFIQSLHKAAKSGSAAAAEVLSQFFKGLVEEPVDISSDQITVNSASTGGIFADFFASQTDDSSKDQLGDFVKFLQNSAKSGNEYAKNMIQNAIARNEADKGKTPDNSVKKENVFSFANIFVTDDDSQQRYEVEPESPFASFLEYLVKATQSGSVVAADLISQWLESDSSNNVENVMDSIWATPEPTKKAASSTKGQGKQKGIFTSMFTFGDDNGIDLDEQAAAIGEKTGAAFSYLRDILSGALTFNNQVSAEYKKGKELVVRRDLLRQLETLKNALKSQRGTGSKKASPKGKFQVRQAKRESLKGRKLAVEKPYRRKPVLERPASAKKKAPAKTTYSWDTFFVKDDSKDNQARKGTFFVTDSESEYPTSQTTLSDAIKKVLPGVDTNAIFGAIGSIFTSGDEEVDAQRTSQKADKKITTQKKQPKPASDDDDYNSESTAADMLKSVFPSFDSAALFKRVGDIFSYNGDGDKASSKDIPAKKSIKTAPKTESKIVEEENVETFADNAAEMLKSAIADFDAEPYFQKLREMFTFGEDDVGSTENTKPTRSNANSKVAWEDSSFFVQDGEVDGENGIFSDSAAEILRSAINDFDAEPYLKKLKEMFVSTEDDADTVEQAVPTKPKKTIKPTAERTKSEAPVEKQFFAGDDDIYEASAAMFRSAINDFDAEPYLKNLKGMFVSTDGDDDTVKQVETKPKKTMKPTADRTKSAAPVKQQFFAGDDDIYESPRSLKDILPDTENVFKMFGDMFVGTDNEAGSSGKAWRNMFASNDEESARASKSSKSHVYKATWEIGDPVKLASDNSIREQARHADESGDSWRKFSSSGCMGLWKGVDSTFDEYCSESCSKGECPENICMCSFSLTSRSEQINCADNRYTNVAGSDFLCQSSCNQAPFYCPSSQCACTNPSMTTSHKCVSPRVCKTPEYVAVPGTIATDSWCSKTCSQSDSGYCPCTLCECADTCRSGLVNGFFDDGLAGWTAVRQLGTKGTVAALIAGQAAPISGNEIPAAASHDQSQGNTVAVFDGDSPGSYVLYQEYTPIKGDYLTFSWLVSNWARGFSISDTMSANVRNQQFRVDLVTPRRGYKWFDRNYEGHVATVLSPDHVREVMNAVGSPPFTIVGPWQTTKFDLSPYAGEKVWIAFRMVNNQGPMNVALDNIAVANLICTPIGIGKAVTPAPPAPIMAEVGNPSCGNVCSLQFK